jgi:acetyl-CoA C-acetyltransferase
VARAALERAGIDGDADRRGRDLADTYRADLPGCSARPIGLRAGVPIEVPGHNLNMHCGTRLKAIVSAGTGHPVRRCALGARRWRWSR